jgi:hypothetical protein
VEKFKEWTDPAPSLPEDAVDRDLILTDVSVYWLTGTAGSAARIYYEGARTWGQPRPKSPVPTAVAVFPNDITLRPIAERDHNVVHWAEFSRGGHFAAWKHPTSSSATCGSSSASSADATGNYAVPSLSSLAVQERIRGPRTQELRARGAEMDWDQALAYTLTQTTQALLRPRPGGSRPGPGHHHPPVVHHRRVLPVHRRGRPARSFPAAHVRRPGWITSRTPLGSTATKLGALLVTAGLGPPAEHALISLLALNGLRVSEATGADIEALGAGRGHRTLCCHPQGRQGDGHHPLAPRTARAIDLAVGERVDGPIFLGPRPAAAGPARCRPDRAPPGPPRRITEPHREPQASRVWRHWQITWTCYLGGTWTASRACQRAGFPSAAALMTA